jgi:Lrp/AsnC family leucine-responsive transcriptional regulator
MASTYESERSERLLDETSWAILDALQQDARLSYAELGRRVNMSSPAVAERVQRLIDAGVIEGFHARVNPAKVGYPIQAIIRIDTNGHDNLARNAQIFQQLQEVIEAQRTTGPDCYVVKVVARDMKRLEEVIDTLSIVGRTTTAIVLKSPLTHKPLGPDGEVGK